MENTQSIKEIKMKNKIQELMEKIIALPNVSVFDVNLKFTSYDTKWLVWASFRNDIPDIQFSDQSPEHALNLLYASLLCDSIDVRRKQINDFADKQRKRINSGRWKAELFGKPINWENTDDLLAYIYFKEHINEYINE